MVSWSPAGQIDWPKSRFLQDKVALSETMMTTMNEVNRDKTKVLYYYFVMFRLSVLLLNSMNNLIHNRCTCELIVRTLPHIRGCKRTIACLLLCFHRLFPVVQFWNYTKTIIPLILNECSRIIPSTSSRGLFDNIHFAFGELLFHIKYIEAVRIVMLNDTVLSLH